MSVIDIRSSTYISHPEGFRPLGVIIGTAIHHSVTFMHTEATESQELNHIRAIDNYHLSLGYGGFGYHAAAFPSGRAYLCGDGQRAHVEGRNHQLYGIVAIGNFVDALPTPAQLDAIRSLIVYPELPVKGHNEWALPGKGTACAGQLNGFDWREGQPDPTLAYRPGLGGLHQVGQYQVLYSLGVPIWRYGGSLPGQTAKNFGGAWRWLRVKPDSTVYFSAEEGD